MEYVKPVITDYGDLADLTTGSADGDFTDAAFPAGPWLVAHTLRCPVYFVAGIYSPPNHYALHFEFLADEVRIDRSQRASALAYYVRGYASMLETYTRSAPLNWFNFYDFWSLCG